MNENKIISANSETAFFQLTETLKNDGVIAIPTDTIYGLACLATSTAAIKKIYNIKGRSFSKPIAICVSSTTEIQKWSHVVNEDVLTDLLPGGVTVILKRKPALNPHLNPKIDSVGIRVPDHAFVLELCKHLDNVPIALTSANKSNHPNAVEVTGFRDIWNDIDIIVDGGKLPKNTASTMVDISVPGSFYISREGREPTKTRTVLTTKYDMQEEFR